MTIQKITYRRDYREARKQLYPPVGEQLDAMYKLGESLREQGLSLPEDVMQWLDKVRSVKDSVPKE